MMIRLLENKNYKGMDLFTALKWRRQIIKSRQLDLSSLKFENASDEEMRETLECIYQHQISVGEYNWFVNKLQKRGITLKQFLQLHKNSTNNLFSLALLI